MKVKGHDDVGPGTKEISQFLKAPIPVPLGSWQALGSKVLVKGLDLSLVFLCSGLLSMGIKLLGL